jgi:hypothetical protein
MVSRVSRFSQNGGALPVQQMLLIRFLSRKDMADIDLKVFLSVQSYPSSLAMESISQQGYEATEVGRWKPDQPNRLDDEPPNAGLRAGRQYLGGKTSVPEATRTNCSETPPSITHHLLEYHFTATVSYVNG